ncbi:hypothetical protein NUM3379_18150 [Kineococcus sp. NUM-3379]
MSDPDGAARADAPTPDAGTAGAFVASGVPAAPAGRRRRDARTLLALQVAAGPCIGLAWWVLTADPPAWLVGEPARTAGSVLAARDGTLAVLGILMGAAAGARVLRHPGRRPLLTLAAGLAGAVLGVVLAVVVARVLPAGVDGARVSPRAWGVTLLWPGLLAGVVFVREAARAVGEWVRG